MNALPATIETAAPLTLYQPSVDPASVYVASLSEGSRRTMLGALKFVRSLIGDAPWESLRHAHVMAIRSRLAESYAPATANRILAALRGTLKEAWRLGLMDAEHYHRAVDIAPIRGTTLPSGRSLSGDELSALVNACGDSPSGIRDAALLAVLYGAGLRRSEAAALDVENYRDGELKVISGKGNKSRIVYVTNGARTALEKWIAIRGCEPGAMFCPINKACIISLRRMTDQSVYGITKKLGERSGIESFSPHDIKRSHISDLLDKGADISMVQRLAGHENPAVTARYDRRPEAAKRRAAELLRFPT